MNDDIKKTLLALAILAACLALGIYLLPSAPGSPGRVPYARQTTGELPRAVPAPVPGNTGGADAALTPLPE